MEEPEDELPDSAPEYTLEEIMEQNPDRPWLGRAKARIILEEKFLEQAFARMGDSQLPTSALVDIAKILTDIGDVKPKQTPHPTQSTPPTINIVFPANPAAAPVIDVVPQSVEEDDTHSTQPTEVNFNTPALDFMHEDPVDDQDPS